MGYDVVLDVRDGEIYTGTRMEHVFPGYPTPTPKMERILPGSSAEEERLGQCGYKSIPEMFELVESAANEFDPGETYLRVSFDPKYGFVSSYDQDCLSSTIADCEVHYSYHDFEPR